MDHLVNITILHQKPYLQFKHNIFRPFIAVMPTKVHLS